MVISRRTNKLSMIEARRSDLKGIIGRDERQQTFLSLFFSAVSSLPALAACLLSCLAVNYAKKGMSISKYIQASDSHTKWGADLRTFRLNSDFRMSA